MSANVKARHPLSDHTVKIVSGMYKGEEYWVEDWLINVLGCLPHERPGNPGCLDYIVRAQEDNLPHDQEIVCGKIGGSSKILNVCELGEVICKGRKFD